MFHVVLYQPEIPPNTGNIIRLCANTGCRLHLIEPLGFEIDDRSLRRAGLDYHEWTTMQAHKNVDACLNSLDFGTLFTFSTHHSVRYDRAIYPTDAVLMFGPETRGLPGVVRERAAPQNRLVLPMMAGNRSMNLSNTVAVTVFEAWRQHNFRTHV